MKTITAKQLATIKENNAIADFGTQKNLRGKLVNTKGILINDEKGIATFLCNDGEFAIDCKILPD